MARPEAYPGANFRIVYAVCASGSPAKEFFDALDPKIQRKFAVSFKKLGDEGKLFNKEHFKAVEGTEFYEFKQHRYRIMCRFLPNRILLLTNGFEKKKERIDRDELRRADRIYQEDRERSGD